MEEKASEIKNRLSKTSTSQEVYLRRSLAGGDVVGAASNSQRHERSCSTPWLQQDASLAPISDDDDDDDDVARRRARDPLVLTTGKNRTDQLNQPTDLGDRAAAVHGKLVYAATASFRRRRVRRRQSCVSNIAAFPINVFVDSEENCFSQPELNEMCRFGR